MEALFTLVSARRSPYGERGLKYYRCGSGQYEPWSLSLRRAWIEIRPARGRQSPIASLSLRRAWIEMLVLVESISCRMSLSLRRAWIEMNLLRCCTTSDLSLSLRRAWIEIYGCRNSSFLASGRSPYGERGLKFELDVELGGHVRRSPYGERGLKFDRGHIAADLRVALLTESVD